MATTHLRDRPLRFRMGLRVGIYAAILYVFAIGGFGGLVLCFSLLLISGVVQEHEVTISLTLLNSALALSALTGAATASSIALHIARPLLEELRQNRHHGREIPNTAP